MFQFRYIIPYKNFSIEEYPSEGETKEGGYLKKNYISNRTVTT